MAAFTSSLALVVAVFCNSLDGRLYVLFFSDRCVLKTHEVHALAHTGFTNSLALVVAVCSILQ
jgi:hypothetical protein